VEIVFYRFMDGIEKGSVRGCFDVGSIYNPVPPTQNNRVTVMQKTKEIKDKKKQDKHVDKKSQDGIIEAE
jgi:hypothetical protein